MKKGFWILLVIIFGLYIIQKISVPSFESYKDKAKLVADQTSNQQAPSVDELFYKNGEFLKLKALPVGKKLNIAKVNGAFDDRQNDLMEICKDWLYYRGKILKYARAGDNSEAAKARSSFNKVNSCLSEYEEKDVAHMFSLIEESGYKSP